MISLAWHKFSSNLTEALAKILKLLNKCNVELLCDRGVRQDYIVNALLFKVCKFIK